MGQSLAEAAKRNKERQKQRTQVENQKSKQELREKKEDYSGGEKKRLQEEIKETQHGKLQALIKKKRSVVDEDVAKAEKERQKDKKKNRDY